MTTTLQSRADYLTTNKKVIIAKAINDRDVEMLWQFLESFLESNNKAKNTIKSYRPKVKRLLADVWQGVNLLRPSRDDVRLALRPLQDKAAATQSAHFSAYAAFYDMLLDADLTDTQPFNSNTRKMLKKDGTQGYKRQPYTTAELNCLINATDNVDLKVALVLTGWVGLRVSEVIKLQWRDIDLSRRMVDVTASKGNKSRSSAIVTPAFDLLSAHKGNDTQPVIAFTAQFETVGVKTDALRAELKALCQATGVKWRGVHSLRHHCATTLLASGATLHAVSQHLGHKNTQTTEGYLHLNEVSSLLNLSL